MSKFQEIQYRYYEMPQGSPILALLGSGWIRPYGSDVDAMHFHNYLEIGYCYDGEGDLALGEKIYRYGNNTVSIIPPNYLHNTIAEPGTKSRCEYLFIDADSFLNSVYPANAQLVKSLMLRINSDAYIFQRERHKEMASLILDIMDLYRYKNELYLECAKGLLHALLIRIACLRPEKDQKLNIVPEGNTVIMNALDYVRDHHREKIQISDMADACHLSETHFRRLFRQYMKIPPLTYVNLVRIETACRMLRTTNESIKDIAIKCGFATLPSFNRNFRSLIGVTPMQWRNDTYYYERLLEKQHIILYNGWQ